MQFVPPVTEEVVNEHHTVNENVDSISTITISTVGGDMIHTIVREELRQFKEEIKNMMQDVLRKMANKFTSSRINRISFEELNKFPLKNLEELQEFDRRFESDSQLREHFEAYITQFGGRAVKKNLKVSTRVYDLEMQKYVSFTGHEA